MDIVDVNQPQADSSIMINKSWKHPTAAKQVIIQRDAAGNDSTWLALVSMRISMELKSLFMLSVRISSYGCTREVWRARKMRKSCPRR